MTWPPSVPVAASDPGAAPELELEGPSPRVVESAPARLSVPSSEPDKLPSCAGAVASASPLTAGFFPVPHAIQRTPMTTEAATRGGRPLTMFKEPTTFPIWRSRAALTHL